jgi:hypothetical protein
MLRCLSRRHQQTVRSHVGDRNLARKIREKKFNDILIESIDEAFLTLGETTRAAIYLNLESKFGLSKQDIPDKVGDFSDALDRIFGQAARQLEVLIMTCLHNKVDCSYGWEGPKWLVPDLTFTKYVKLVELCCEDTDVTGDIEVLLDDGEKQEQHL